MHPDDSQKEVQVIPVINIDIDFMRHSRTGRLKPVVLITKIHTTRCTGNVQELTSQLGLG
jgi:hypothetical protein